MNDSREPIYEVLSRGPIPEYLLGPFFQTIIVAERILGHELEFVNLQKPDGKKAKTINCKHCGLIFGVSGLTNEEVREVQRELAIEKTLDKYGSKN